jgi:hypothetical protein
MTLRYIKKKVGCQENSTARYGRILLICAGVSPQRSLARNVILVFNS